MMAATPVVWLIRFMGGMSALMASDDPWPAWPAHGTDGTSEPVGFCGVVMSLMPIAW
jgi:hypothetical protein